MRQDDKNTIENALVESFGLEGFKQAFERCRSSKRFASLVALASTDQFDRLVVAAKKLADNPKTAARF